MEEKERNCIETDVIMMTIRCNKEGRKDNILWFRNIKKKERKPQIKKINKELENEKSTVDEG